MMSVLYCPTCGSPRRYDAPGGVCPACLLKAAFVDGAASANGGATNDGAGHATERLATCAFCHGARRSRDPDGFIRRGPARFTAGY